MIEFPSTLDEFDLDEAQALCSMFEVGLVIMDNHLFMLAYHWSKHGCISYDWAYLKRLDREEWRQAIAALIGREQVAHLRFSLQRA